MIGNLEEAMMTDRRRLNDYRTRLTFDSRPGMS